MVLCNNYLIGLCTQLRLRLSHKIACWVRYKKPSREMAPQLLGATSVRTTHRPSDVKTCLCHRAADSLTGPLRTLSRSPRHPVARAVERDRFRRHVTVALALRTATDK